MKGEAEPEQVLLVCYGADLQLTSDGRGRLAPWGGGQPPRKAIAAGAAPLPPVVARRRGAGGAARPSSRRRQRPPPRASDGRANARARERERDPRTTRASESDERERNGKTPAQEKPRVRDERQSRPSTLKEMNAQRGYSPYKCIYNRSDGTQCEWNIACYLSCEDLGIICSLFIVLWACLLGIYTLLLKAALDTDEKDTALWIFFAFGVLFTMFVAGAVGMNQVEEALNEKYNPKEDA